LNFDVRIKNVSSRNDTSHMAVISTEVLFLGIFTLGILPAYYFQKILSLWVDEILYEFPYSNYKIFLLFLAAGK
jgi:hypothetical protein